MIAGGEMNNLEACPKLKQIYDFALPAMFETMVACGRLAKGQEAQMHAGMRACGVRLLWLLAGIV